MLVNLLTLLPICFPLQDLRPGESLQRIELSAPAHSASTLAGGRVVDARTGSVVHGAQIELWTEEIAEQGSGYRLVGEARSVETGQFQIPLQRAGLQGDKLRVRHPDYLAFLGTVGDLELIRLVPADEEPLRLRVVDLAGRPIAGARFSSTYSCAHDVSGFDVLTDVTGWASLPEYGLQPHLGELRLRASGYEAIKYLAGEEFLPGSERSRAEGSVVSLARQQGFSARVLDGEGQPLRGRALKILDGDGHHVCFTDSEGVFRVEASYGGDEFTIELLEETSSPFIYAGPLPSATQVTLRLPSPIYRQVFPQGTLIIEGAEDLDGVFVFHADGWTDQLSFQEGSARLALPMGKAWLHWGSTFSGWTEQTLPIEIEAGQETRVQLAPRREARLSLELPPGEPYELCLQAGEHSRRFNLEDSGRLQVYVPSGVPLRLLAESRRMTLRAAHEPLAGDASWSLIDPQPDQVQPRSEPAVLEEWIQRIALAGPDGRACAGNLSVQGPASVERIGAFSFEVRAPREARLLLKAQADGFAERFEPVASWGEVVPETLTLTPLARLVLDLPEGGQVLGPLGERLDALHPGPLSLAVRLGEGRAVQLDLVLQPGEVRRLKLR